MRPTSFSHIVTILKQNADLQRNAAKKPIKKSDDEDQTDDQDDDRPKKKKPALTEEDEGEEQRGGEGDEDDEDKQKRARALAEKIIEAGNLRRNQQVALSLPRDPVARGIILAGMKRRNEISDSEYERLLKRG